MDAEGRNRRPSLEQIQPGAGYHSGNVAILCGWCNRRLSDCTPAQLRRLADFRGRLQAAAKP